MNFVMDLCVLFVIFYVIGVNSFSNLIHGIAVSGPRLRMSFISTFERPFENTKALMFKLRNSNSRMEVLNSILILGKGAKYLFTPGSIKSLMVACIDTESVSMVISFLDLFNSSADLTNELIYMCVHESCRRNFGDIALECFIYGLERDMRIDSYLINSLIQALTRTGKLDMACSILERAHYLEFGTEVKTEILSYSQLLDRAERDENRYILERILALIRSNRKSRPDEDTLMSALMTCAFTTDFPGAYEVFNIYEKTYGVTPSRVYSLLLSCYVSAARLSNSRPEAMNINSLVENMIQSRMDSTLSLASLILQYFCCRRDLNKAEIYLTRCQLMNLKLSTSSFVTYADLICEVGDIERAISLKAAMRQCGMVPLESLSAMVQRTTADDSLRTIPLATTATAAKLLRNAFASNDQEIKLEWFLAVALDCFSQGQFEESVELVKLLVAAQPERVKHDCVFLQILSEVYLHRVPPIILGDSVILLTQMFTNITEVTYNQQRPERVNKKIGHDLYISSSDSENTGTAGAGPPLTKPAKLNLVHTLLSAPIVEGPLYEEYKNTFREVGFNVDSFEGIEEWYSAEGHKLLRSLVTKLYNFARQMRLKQRAQGGQEAMASRNNAYDGYDADDANPALASDVKDVNDLEQRRARSGPINSGDEDYVDEEEEDFGSVRHPVDGGDVNGQLDGGDVKSKVDGGDVKWSRMRSSFLLSWSTFRSTGYGVLLTGLLRMRLTEQHQLIFDLFLQMLREGHPATRTHIRDVLSYFMQHPKENRAIELLTAMVSSKYFVDDSTFRLCIRGLCRTVPPLVDVHTLLDLMQQNGMQPSAHTHKEVILAMVTAGNVEEATAYLRSLEATCFEQGRALEPTIYEGFFMEMLSRFPDGLDATLGSFKGVDWAKIKEDHQAGQMSPNVSQAGLLSTSTSSLFTFPREKLQVSPLVFGKAMDALLDSDVARKPGDVTNVLTSLAKKNLDLDPDNAHFLMNKMLSNKDPLGAIEIFDKHFPDIDDFCPESRAVSVLVTALRQLSNLSPGGKYRTLQLHYSSKLVKHISELRPQLSSVGIYASCSRFSFDAGDLDLATEFMLQIRDREAVHCSILTKECALQKRPDLLVLLTSSWLKEPPLEVVGCTIAGLTLEGFWEEALFYVKEFELELQRLNSVQAKEKVNSKSPQTESEIQQNLPENRIAWLRAFVLHAASVGGQSGTARRVLRWDSKYFAGGMEGSEQCKDGNVASLLRSGASRAMSPSAEEQLGGGTPVTVRQESEMTAPVGGTSLGDQDQGDEGGERGEGGHRTNKKMPWYPQLHGEIPERFRFPLSLTVSELEYNLALQAHLKFIDSSLWQVANAACSSPSATGSQPTGSQPVTPLTQENAAFEEGSLHDAVQVALFEVANIVQRLRTLGYGLHPSNKQFTFEPLPQPQSHQSRAAVGSENQRLVWKAITDLHQHISSVLETELTTVNRPVMAGLHDTRKSQESGNPFYSHPQESKKVSTSHDVKDSTLKTVPDDSTLNTVPDDVNASIAVPSNADDPNKSDAVNAALSSDPADSKSDAANDRAGPLPPPRLWSKRPSGDEIGRGPSRVGGGSSTKRALVWEKYHFSNEELMDLDLMGRAQTLKETPGRWRNVTLFTAIQRFQKQYTESRRKRINLAISANKKYGASHRVTSGRQMWRFDNSSSSSSGSGSSDSRSEGDRRSEVNDLVEEVASGSVEYAYAAGRKAGTAGLGKDMEKAAERKSNDRRYGTISSPLSTAAAASDRPSYAPVPSSPRRNERIDQPSPLSTADKGQRLGPRATESKLWGGPESASGQWDSLAPRTGGKGQASSTDSRRTAAAAVETSRGGVATTREVRGVVTGESREEHGEKAGRPSQPSSELDDIVFGDSESEFDSAGPVRAEVIPAAYRRGSLKRNVQLFDRLQYINSSQKKNRDIT